jgi:hypothetical protein
VEPGIAAAVLGIVWKTGIVELQARPYPFSTTPGERPAATPLARHEARTGNEVTNLRHERVALGDEAVLRTLSILDGTRTPGELDRELELPPGTASVAIRLLASDALLTL